MWDMSVKTDSSLKKNKDLIFQYSYLITYSAINLPVAISLLFSKSL